MNRPKIIFPVSLILGVSLLSYIIRLNLPSTSPTQPQVLAVSSEQIQILPTPTPTAKPLPSIPQIDAKSFVIKKMSSDTIIGKDVDTRLPPASTTKMMTALTAVSLYPLDKVITVGKPYQVGVTIGLMENEQITIENLLYGLLLESGNDVAMAIAGGVDKSDQFISVMNQKVSELGLLNTQFVNPSGLDHPDHYSSAYDLALIGESLLSNSLLSKIVNTKSSVIYDQTRQITHSLSNRNKLLGKDGVIGIKTGYTDTAGEVLVTAVQRDNHNYIIVVMGSQDRFHDTQILINWLDVYLHPDSQKAQYKLLESTNESKLSPTEPISPTSAPSL